MQELEHLSVIGGCLNLIKSLFDVGNDSYWIPLNLITVSKRCGTRLGAFWKRSVKDRSSLLDLADPSKSTRSLVVCRSFFITPWCGRMSEQSSGSWLSLHSSLIFDSICCRIVWSYSRKSGSSFFTRECSGNKPILEYNCFSRTTVFRNGLRFLQNVYSGVEIHCPTGARTVNFVLDS